MSCDFSLVTDWRIDPPQEVRTFSQDFLHNTLTSNSLSRHFLISFAYGLEGPLCCIPFSSASFFELFSAAIPYSDGAFPQHLGAASRIRIFSDLLQPLHDPCPFPFAFPLDLLVLPLYEHESFFSPLLLQLLKLVEDLLLVLFGCCLLHVLFAHHQICQNFLSFAQNAPLTVSQRLSSSIRPSNCSSHLT